MSTAVAERRSFPYRIKDLVAKTGLTKETIHYYISEGLLPKARKTSKNMAWYGEEHIDRLRMIKDLQEKQFLPLKAIKAVLTQEGEYDFTPAQQRIIASIQTRLSETAAARETVPLQNLRMDTSPEEVREMADAGLIAVDEQGRVSDLDADILRAWDAVRRLGFTPERGFSPRDLEVFADVVDVLFDQEVKLLQPRIVELEDDEAARMMEGALPRINELIGLLHTKKVHQFLTNFRSGRQGEE